MHTRLRIGGREISVEHPEFIVLRVDGNTLVSENAHPLGRSLEYQVKEALSKEGIKWGDAITWVTKKVGIEQCPKCKARQKILNEAKKLGIAETIRQIKETFCGSK